MERPSNSDKVGTARPPLPSPKRGPFPAPRADIEKDTPYLIETDPAKEDEA
jgi:hypothetical protein